MIITLYNVCYYYFFFLESQEDRVDIENDYNFSEIKCAFSLSVYKILQKHYISLDVRKLFELRNLKHLGHIRTNAKSISTGNRQDQPEMPR